jgi:magnesium and cobalt transporter
LQNWASRTHIEPARLDRVLLDEDMGDTSDGSPGAAQGAPLIGKRERPGLFERLFGESVAMTRAANSTSITNGETHHAVFVHGQAHLNRVTVQDVAVPRAEIVSVAVDTPLDALVNTFRESGLTRLPVFVDTLDNPIGLVHLKDLALKHGFASDNSPLDLKSMVRPLLFAPPSMPIGVLLQKMQTDRIHMALVIDEYGGVDGLVTIEDLIEQVVGEIEDEHDVDEDESWTEEKPGVFSCLARTELDDFSAEIGFDLSPPNADDEVDTLGGLVFLLAGRVPVRGEVIRHESGVEFEVLDADPRRIKRLRVMTPTARDRH